MTCYFRHLKEVFKEAGIEVTSKNRLEVDKVIRHIVGAEKENCPATWKEIKRRMAENEQEFAGQLKAAWKKSGK